MIILQQFFYKLTKSMSYIRYGGNICSLSLVGGFSTRRSHPCLLFLVTRFYKPYSKLPLQQVSHCTVILYNSFLCNNLKYPSVVRYPNHCCDFHVVESIQRKFTRSLVFWRNLPYSYYHDRLTFLQMTSLQKYRSQTNVCVRPKGQLFNLFDSF